MDIVRYIHAADLHLDTPFQGLAREAAQSGHLSRIMQDATFTALERLFRFCEEKRPDFLVLAGDIYNQENYSAKAQLALRDGCRRLDALGIRVFMAHGNHDPLSSRLTAIHWPENVTVFGPDVESRLVEKDGQPLALVHGISHAGSRENRNLAQLFRRDDTQSVFQLGVLHCTVEGEATGTVTNEGTGTVTVGNEAVAKPVEVTEAEVKVGTLHDTRVDGSQIPDEDLVGTYTVTGTKTTVGTTNTYTLTLTATDLKAHQNAGTPESMGYWAGIMVKADKTDEYMFGWGTYPGTFNKAGDLSSESPESQDGFVGFYRNFGADNASNSFYIAVKDSSGNIDIYNVACNVTKG